MRRGDAALIAAATRHVAAQVQLDLSACTGWTRFVEVHYTVGGGRGVSGWMGWWASGLVWGLLVHEWPVVCCMLFQIDASAPDATNSQTRA